MKSYIYTYSEKDRKHAEVWHCHKTVRVYRMVRNEPVFLIERTDTFVDQFQLVLDAMWEFRENAVSPALKAHNLPKAAFEKHPTGGWKHCYAYKLQEAGIATFRQL